MATLKCNRCSGDTFIVGTPLLIVSAVSASPFMRGSQRLMFRAWGFGQMTNSEPTLGSSVEVDAPVRRFEIFTDAGRRPDWSAEVIAVAEVVQLAARTPQGVPAVVAPEPASTLERTVRLTRPQPRRSPASLSGRIAGVAAASSYRWGASQDRSSSSVPSPRS